MNESAIARFRAALHRLVDDCPERLPKGSPITQNNVAREAGVDPSALKKKRYPLIVEEIQKRSLQYRDERQKDQLTIVDPRKARRDLREVCRSLTKERDHALNLLVDADAEVLRLMIEVKRLNSIIDKKSRTSKVAPSKTKPNK